MAGDWIKMRVSLLDNPRVLRVAELLDVDDVDLIIGKLFRLWCHADQHTTDGVIPHGSAAVVDRIVGYPGFGSALMSVGWLELWDQRDPNSGAAVRHAVITRFVEHNGRSAKRRALQAGYERQRREHDVDKPLTPDAHAREQTVSMPCSRDAHGEPTNGRQNAHGVPTKIRDKRSEFLGDESPKNPSCPERPKPAASGPVPDVWGKPPVQFHSSDHRWVGVTEQHRATWAEAYPAVDIDRELARAAAWCVSNPAKGRKSNYLRFLTGWLQRAQDNAGRTQMGRGGQEAAGAGESADEMFERIYEEERAKEGRQCPAKPTGTKSGPADTGSPSA
jgi:hypothetical protein